MATARTPLGISSRSTSGRASFGGADTSKEALVHVKSAHTQLKRLAGLAPSDFSRNRLRLLSEARADLERASGAEDCPWCERKIKAILDALGGLGMDTSQATKDRIEILRDATGELADLMPVADEFHEKYDKKGAALRSLDEQALINDAIAGDPGEAGEDDENEGISKEEMDERLHGPDNEDDDEDGDDGEDPWADQVHATPEEWEAAKRNISQAAEDDAPTLDRLKVEAMDVAQAGRGHVLGPWEDLVPGRSAEATCTRCGLSVDVDRKPPPNGIDIGGAALASNCSGLSLKDRLLAVIKTNPQKTWTAEEFHRKLDGDYSIPTIDLAMKSLAAGVGGVKLFYEPSLGSIAAIAPDMALPDKADGSTSSTLSGIATGAPILKKENGEPWLPAIAAIRQKRPRVMRFIKELRSESEEAARARSLAENMSTLTPEQQAEVRRLAKTKLTPSDIEAMATQTEVDTMMRNAVPAGHPDSKHVVIQHRDGSFDLMSKETLKRLRADGYDPDVVEGE